MSNAENKQKDFSVIKVNFSLFDCNVKSQVVAHINPKISFEGFKRHTLLNENFLNKQIEGSIKI